VLNPVAPNPPATPRDPYEPYWSLIPASRAGAFAWHPPIFLNSAGQFPPPVPTYDPPVPPVYGLFGIAKMPAASAAANARPIGGGGGLFDSLAGLSAANTDAPPSIFGAIARPPYAAPMPGSNPSPSPSYPPYLGGSALPPYWADPPPPDPTLFAWLPQSPGPIPAGDSPLGPWNGVPIASPQGPATAAPPTRSVLFNDAPAAWDPGAPDRNAANLDQTARTLGLSDLPISKSGVPVVSPPPQLSITPQQGRDVAHLVSPNLVDYLTKSLPPAPPLPSTPGKIPSSDNPYALGAAFEGATWLLGGLERGIVGPLEGAASTAEKSAMEAALQAGRTAAEPALQAARTTAESAPRLTAVERLQMHVDNAHARLEREGLTEGQEDSLKLHPGFEAAHRGERIDTFAKETIAKDESLGHLIITPRFQFGPDFYDPINKVWYDITTRRQWPSHVKQYTDQFGQGTPLFYGDK
jgi:hypothetical protein